MTSPDAWPTPTATDRAGRTTNVIPLFPDQPAIAALRGGRPLRLHFDAWLHAGGRELGYQGAASVEVQAAPGVLGTLIAALDEEVEARGWGIEDIETASVVEGRELRFYWWTTDVTVTARLAAGEEHTRGEARPMATAHDVAAYVLRARGPMTAMKMQKLVYYSQAWSLVWDEEPLFTERIEAWANGPVIPDLYREHRGRFQLKEGDIPGDPDALSEDQRETVDAVLNGYGPLSAHQLSELTHRERPWLRARQGLSAGERGNAEIARHSMAEYYDSLVPGENGTIVITDIAPEATPDDD